MKYHLEFYYTHPITKVVDALIQLDQMKVWQKELVDLEVVKGIYPEKGFVGYLIYQGQSIKSRMKVTVIENNLPKKLVFLYEIPGVKNECVYIFQQEKDGTRLEMDVSFDFADGIIRPQTLFEQETIKIMNLHKEYVEKE